LGVILFEAIARERLQPLKDPTAMVLDTVYGVDVRQRANELGADFPPELLELCARATAVDPKDRPQSARELAEGIEHYLAGVRDLRLRSELAASHVKAAVSAQQAARSGDLSARRGALREVGRALALDPSNRDALRTMVELISQPMQELPADAREEFDRRREDQIRHTGRLGAIGYGLMLFYLPFLWWMGVRDRTALAALLTSFIVASAVSYFASRVPTERAVLGSLLVSSAMVGLTSLVFGAFIVVPSFAAVNTMAYGHVFQRMRALGVSIGLLGFLVPAGLEVAGVTHSYAFVGSALQVLPRLVELPATATFVMLTLSGVATIAGFAFMLGSLSRALTIAQERLYLQAWNLRQLVPDEVTTDSGVR
jgi:hypothetical protein